MAARVCAKRDVSVCEVCFDSNWRINKFKYANKTRLPTATSNEERLRYGTTANATPPSPSQHRTLLSLRQTQHPYFNVALVAVQDAAENKVEIAVREWGGVEAIGEYAAIGPAFHPNAKFNRFDGGFPVSLCLMTAVKSASGNCETKK